MRAAGLYSPYHSRGVNVMAAGNGRGEGATAQNPFGKRTADFLVYEHGERIAVLEAGREEIKNSLVRIESATKESLLRIETGNKEALSRVESNLAASSMVMAETAKQLEKLVNRAWGVKKTLLVGGAVFATVGGLLLSFGAWVVHATGMTIVLGG